MGILSGYTHEQSTPSTTWTVAHNFGTVAPVVDCYVVVNGQSLKILPNNVRAVNANVVEITWTTARTGFARIM